MCIRDRALNQAKDGRTHILTEMNKAIKSSRKEVSKYTPKIETVKVDKKDIAAVIGKGGATIREIVELSGAKVDVKDTGEVTIAAPDEESRKKAMEMVKNIVAKPEMGKIYKGKVVKIMEFGAFVNFLGKQDGLVHISQLAGKRVAKVSDVVKEGDEVELLLYKMTDLGMNAIVDNLYKGLIFKSDIHKDIRVGDRVRGYVKQVRKDGKIDLALEPIGYKDSIEKTADIILSSIKDNDGVLSLTDNSSPEEISETGYTPFQLYPD